MIIILCATPTVRIIQRATSVMSRRVLNSAEIEGQNRKKKKEKRKIEFRMRIKSSDGMHQRPSLIDRWKPVSNSFYNILKRFNSQILNTTSVLRSAIFVSLLFDAEPFIISNPSFLHLRTSAVLSYSRPTPLTNIFKKIFSISY